MLKSLLFTALLFIVTTSTAQNSIPQIDFMAESYPEANAMLNAYEELYLYLLNQDDLTIQLSIPTFSYRIFTEEYTNTYKKVLEKAININSSPFVIFRADTICHAYSSLTDWCHELNIHEIHKKIDPNNLLTYLLNLHSNDPENKQHLAEAALYSKFSNVFFHYNTIELSEHIEDYIDATPEFLDVDYDDPEIAKAEFENILQQSINKGLITQAESVLVKTKPEANITSITIAMYMANVQPNYNSVLYKTCQDNQSQEACKTIAEVLNNSTSLSSKNIAKTILTHQYEQLGYEDEILKLKEQQKELYKKFSCYSTLDAHLIMMINENNAKSHIENLKQFGELEAWKLLAFKVFNIKQEHGFNPDFNPKDCE